MDFDEYFRSKQFDYAALAETVASILQAALAAYPGTFRLQQVQHRAKNPESLKKKLEDRKLESTCTLEADIKDLAGCRLIFYKLPLNSTKIHEAPKCFLNALLKLLGLGDILLGSSV